jgi:hypothetical protein
MADPLQRGPRALAHRLAAAYGAIPEVEAVALGGSLASSLADACSDLDLYVYAAREPSLEARAVVAAGGQGLELGNRSFEPGDEWRDAATGMAVDVMFRTRAWIEDQLDRVLVRHEARLGYTTCFWHGVRTSEPLLDRRGWYRALQARAAVPYPEPLRRNVVTTNLAVMAHSQSSFLHQLERAWARGDAVAVNHRTAAFLACAFDVLFALNRQPHPGEKRLLEQARRGCPLRPPGFEEAVGELLAAPLGGPAPQAARALGAGLQALARAEGLVP